MRAVIENWTGKDSELLAELNRPQHKRVIGDGMVTLAMISNLSIELAAALAYTLDSVIQTMESGPQKQQATLLRYFEQRLNVSDRGLDFSNDVLRSQVSTILQSAGWAAEQINLILSLGAVYESDAYLAIQRDATQQDIDTIRAVMAREAIQTRWSELFASDIQPALQTGTREEVIVAIRAVADAMGG